MSAFSLLPESYAGVETWIVRVFIFLGLFIIGPWALLVLYDIVLYATRTALFYIPLVGGRARGQRHRPRAPSLRERLDGEARVMFPLGNGAQAEKKKSKDAGDASHEGPDSAEAATSTGELRRRDRQPQVEACG